MVLCLICLEQNLLLSKNSVKNLKLNFLKFEYSGHGKSTGKFIEGNISKWTNEAKLLIKSKVKKNTKLVFIGSSMGSWIASKPISMF